MGCKKSTRSNGQSQRQKSTVKSQRPEVNGQRSKSQSPEGATMDDVAVNGGQQSLTWRADVALGLTCLGLTWLHRKEPGAWGA
jgi:hypothetical protein